MSSGYGIVGTGGGDAGVSGTGIGVRRLYVQLVLEAEDDFAACGVTGQRVITGSGCRQHFRFAATRK